MATIHITKIGLGLVTSTPSPLIFSPDIVCGGVCDTANIITAPAVPWNFQVTALADPGFVFVGWTTASGPILPPSSLLSTETFTLASADFPYEIIAQFDPCPTITISPSTPITYQLNTLFLDLQFVGSGGTGSYTFEVDPGFSCPNPPLCFSPVLPIGMSLSLSGLLTGTPTAVAECGRVAIRVTDANGCTNTTCIDMVLQQCPTITIGPPSGTCTNGIIDTPFNLQYIASSGTAPYTWTLTNGSLPTGLTLNPNTGLISGVPTVAGECTQYNIRATDVNGCFGQTGLGSNSILICPDITINPPTLPGGFVSIVYNQTIISSGGTPPVGYTITVGTLPPGLSLDPGTGTITGTPTLVGSYNFTVTVTDSTECERAQCLTLCQNSKPYTIVIEEPLFCYDLISCDISSYPSILVTNNLTQYVGQVIQILGKCFTVQVAQSCVGAITLQGLPVIIPAFIDCCACNPPPLYLLTDCTLQTPQIATTQDLSQYLNQTIKVCDFNSNSLIPISGGITFNCFNLNQKGFVTLITGPTSGFYYEVSSTLIKPYTNPLLFPLIAGSGICVNPVSPFDVVTYPAPTVYTIQFFLGTIPITNPIVINNNMNIATCQFFINQQIIVTGITITVLNFSPFGLDVNVNITDPVTESLIIVVTPPITIPPTFPPTTAITTPFTGSCICYTVTSPGTTCEDPPPFTGVISGVFADCVCCDPPPTEPEPPYVPTIPEIDKKTYFIPESQCDIDANKTFANAMFDIFKTEAYGMESCCPRNFDKIWIQKELSDLSKTKC